jgi:hypothetical protein
MRPADGSRGRGRSYPIFVALVALAMILVNPIDVLAVAPNGPCGPTTLQSYYDGADGVQTGHNGVAGASASISSYSSLLCTTASDNDKGSFTFVAVGNANAGSGYSVYQFGLAKCSDPDYIVCTGSYRIFYAWGRELNDGNGACTEAKPSPRDLGAAPSGTHNYEVVRTSTLVKFILDGTTIHSIAASNISCWTSTGMNYTGESWDTGDEIGGVVGVHQNLSGALYETSVGSSWTSPSFVSCSGWPQQYDCLRVNGQRVEIWTDRS